MGETNINSLVHAGPTLIPNKSNEPETKMGITLNKVVFKCGEHKKPVNVAITLFNKTNETISYKVRCTSAELFRVQPPIGVLPKDGKADLLVWFQNNSSYADLNGKHYFAFYNYKGDCRVNKEVTKSKICEGVYRVPAIFEK